MSKVSDLPELDAKPMILSEKDMEMIDEYMDMQNFKQSVEDSGLKNVEVGLSQEALDSVNVTIDELDMIADQYSKRVMKEANLGKNDAMVRLAQAEEDKKKRFVRKEA